MDRELITYESFQDSNIPFLFTDDGRVIINNNHCYSELVATTFDMLVGLDDEVIFNSIDENFGEWFILGNTMSSPVYNFMQKCIAAERNRRNKQREKLMKDLAIVKSESFGSIQCDFYRKDDEIWMTREQIGTALEYCDPKVAVSKIHDRHKDRLDKFSGVTKLGTPGGIQETYIYSTRGIYEICRWSKQPKADAFFDWVYDILEGLRKGELTITKAQQQPQPTSPMKLPDKRQLEAHAKLLNARTRQAKFLLNTAEEYKNILSGEEIREIVIQATALTHGISQ